MLPDDIPETVRHALAEDIGAGDLTAALIPGTTPAVASVISRENIVLCGTAWFGEVFRQLDPTIRVSWQARDGAAIQAGQVLCRIAGPARALLTGERTALNFLQTLSGTATRAKRYADAVKDTGAKILDTRKTLPGLRTAQKYAVTCGGCHNHRIGLFDGILVKENHIMATGSLTAAVQKAKAIAVGNIMVEIEVENLDELREALAAGAKRLLLDNFDLATLRAAVQETRGRAELEASGGITFENIRAIAETGVDFISIGDLTKNVQAADLSMRFEN
ncbi:MAG TPA: carboxylating nicotinate-nucleotide diphosphorylase [Acidiferrobacterales bacterium]|nr:carboxylating nicotinate-nucleotide diphosphorylase [Acidiferrobacterales bacterium]